MSVVFLSDRAIRAVQGRSRDEIARAVEEFLDESGLVKRTEGEPVEVLFAAVSHPDLPWGDARGLEQFLLRKFA